MEALARLATRRPIAVSVFAAACVILGWTAWGGLPLDLLPDLQSPTLVVSLRSGDRPPLEMERIYAEALEQRLFAVRGIRQVSQVARTGRLVATVVFDWGADLDFAVVETEKAVGPLRSDVTVDELLVRRVDPRQSAVLTIGLLANEGGPDLVELRRLARRQLATALERLEGVAEVRVTGGRELEVRVSTDRARLESHGLDIQTLESRLRAANRDIQAGTIEDGNRVFLLRGMARFATVEDVAQLVLRYEQGSDGRRVATRLEDVAEVSLGTRDINHLVRIDGREGVGLAIFKESGSNTVAVSRNVRRALEGLNADLPGVTTHVVTDEASLVESALGDLQSAAILGVVLSILVLLLFLRAAGPTLLVGTAVPVSLLTTLFVMHLAGQSLNLMTLGGLALGAGMLVDNAIVVVESIFRRRAEGDSPEDAAARGTGRVGGAIVASTLTTCAVFLPVIFIRGLSARLVSGLAFTVIVSLLVSLVVSIFLVPALAKWLLPRGKTRAVDPGSLRLERLVGRVLRRPFLVVGAALLLTAVSTWALLRLGSELLPPADPYQLSARIVGPTGSGVEATAERAAAVEELLRQIGGDEIEAILSEVGRLPDDDRVIREEQNEENTARVMVSLRPGGRGAQAIVAAAIPAIESMAPFEVSWEVGASALARAMGTTGPSFVAEISGTSLDDLRAGAALLRNAMVARPELWNVRSSFEGGPPELRLELDRSIADGMGISLDMVAASLQAGLDGLVVTTMTTGDEDLPVVLRLPRVAREELLRLPLSLASGVRFQVGDVVRIHEEEGAREIFRRDQRRVARVTARIAPGNDYPAGLQALRQSLAETPLPAGLTARVAGEEEERTRTLRDLGFAGALALLLVFMVLAGTFESLVHPLTIVAAVPLALPGVALALVPSGRPIGVMELLGLIVLSGVAVNDAILLVSAAREQTAAGLGLREALARAAGLRLRPIVMTTATTVLALLPLALSGGEAAQLRRPMAMTIIGGLIASTLASLFVIPAIYLLIDRLRPQRKTR